MGYERNFRPPLDNVVKAPLLAPAIAEPSARPVPDLQTQEGERWYAVHARPLKETLAELQLRRQNFRTFLPRQPKTIRHARKIRVVDAAMFPRYLFVILDLDRDRWRSVNGTSGVSSLVMSENRPLALPEGVVETLLRSADGRGIVKFQDPMWPGQPIRLRAGPFAEALGEVSRLDDAGRVEVLMKILNGDVRLNLRRDWVEPLVGA